MGIANERGPSFPAHPLVQPVGVGDAGHRVGHPLQRGGDGDDLLDGAAQPLPVVLPVHQAPGVWHLSRFACQPAEGLVTFSSAQ